MASKSRPKKIGAKPGDPGFVNVSAMMKGTLTNLLPKAKVPKTKPSSPKRRGPPTGENPPNVRVIPKRKGKR